MVLATHQGGKTAGTDMA